MLRTKNGPWINSFFGNNWMMLSSCKRFISVANSKFTENKVGINSKPISSNYDNKKLKKSHDKVDINSIQGTLDYGDDGLYVFSCLCNICNSKITKKFSKKAYNEGIVIIRCDNCKNHHLVSDKLGWFGDERETFDVFKLLNNKEISIN
ncbi:uncharacterized protein cubi_02074 [Cryptosporidium ubiquitum]|uniref:DNL-type domain-containing protein n=1 Tax=Cryptosporidium ubiquitum TaxID=857276 RepID=A0A1J4MMT5_9CRYT|nr:uncharacterized protein cubi_02074 [Cryptosporidium ubiquitum]OII75553.1 hypothetical protein cubi_02074 [Cryptosporidium ubiquitum]